MAVKQKDARLDKQEHCCIRDIRHNHWRHNKSVYLDKTSVAKPAPPASYAKPRPASAKRKAEHHQLIPSFYSKLSQSPDNMSQPQYAPAATAGGQQNGPVSRSYAATCRLENRSLIRLRSISITAIDTDYLYQQTFNLHTSMI